MNTRFSVSWKIKCGLVWALFLGACHQQAQKDSSVRTSKPSFVLYMASKNIEAAEFMQEIIPVLTAVGDAVDIEIDYIGKEEEGKLHSLLGDPEIKGDIFALCANAVEGRDRQLNLVACMSKEWNDIPRNWERCAQSLQIDIEKVKSCADSEKGKALLRESFRRSEASGVTRGPAVFLNGASYNGPLTEPSLGRAICDAIKSDKPPYCDNVPTPVQVPITIVEDRRCRHRNCSIERIAATLSKFVEGANLEVLDYSDPRGEALFRTTKQKYLPVVIVSNAIKKDKRGLRKIGGYLRKMEGSENFFYPLGAEWDPTQEICDDNVDNDENGKVDCEDDFCEGNRECRDEIENSLVMFGMSHCSYSIRAAASVDEVLKCFGNDRKKIDFSIAFVGTVKDGDFKSLHGDQEVREELRQVCAQKHYAKMYKFMEYFLCRGEMLLKNKGMESREADWTHCAENGINVDVIRKCAEGKEGKTLLEASYEEAKKLQMSGAPRWLFNNKIEIVPKSAEAIKSLFCESNPMWPECEKTLSKTESMRDYCGGRPPPQ